MSTKIDYLDESWNPIAMRCDRVSEGCRNCWHLRMAKRMAENPSLHPMKRRVYKGEVGPVQCLPKDFTKPLRWKKSRVVGVQFMGDLWHDSIPFEWVDRVLAVVALCPQHTFMALTKRAARMVEYFKQRDSCESRKQLADFIVHESIGARPGHEWCMKWPLPNLWPGVSVENQAAADERLPELMKLAAMGWKTWVSLEPLLGSVHLRKAMNKAHIEGNVKLDGLGWIIAGGETGPGARPCHPDLVRSLRDQAQEAGVPFYFKNWGCWSKTLTGQLEKPNHLIAMDLQGKIRPCPNRDPSRDEILMTPIKHRKGNDLLDGREYRAMPEEQS